MIGEVATGQAATYDAAVTVSQGKKDLMVLTAMHLDAGRAGQIIAASYNDGTWRLGNRHGGMLAMNTELVEWIRGQLDDVVESPGGMYTARRNMLWVIYNPGGQFLNIVIGSANVFIEGIDHIRKVADFLGGRES